MRDNIILTLDRRGFLTPPLWLNSPPLVGGARGGGSRKAQRAFSTIEYALLIAVAVAALITMSVYIKRAVSGRFKDTADSFGFGRQYEPGVTIEITTKSAED